MYWTDETEFEDPDRWSDEDFDLSELSPEDWPQWALDQLPESDR